MANAPKNRRKDAKRFLLLTLAAGIGIFFVVLHVPGQWDGSADSISNIVTHVLTQPFDIFPLSKEAVPAGLCLSVLSMLLLYNYFLSRRQLRPGEESGSASWNENLKKYYSRYADSKMAVKLPRIKKKGLFFKIINGLLTELEWLLFGWTMTLNEDVKGTKGWQIDTNERGEITSVKHTGTKNMILSNDVVLSMNTRQTFRNNNVLVLGGSGTGKSRYLIKPNMLQANASFVITDPSGELLASMGHFLEECGYELKVFNLVQFDHSNCYNPFNYIRNEEGVLTMINALIKNTTPKGSHSNDPFWEKAETALLQAICFYLIAECNPDDQNFTSVMKLLRCAEAKEGHEDEDSLLDILFKRLADKDPEHIACQSYAVFKSAGGGKTAQSILISCQTRLQVFNLKSIHRLTGTDDINLMSIGDRPTALFCITPVVDTTFNFLVALLYTQLFESLYFHAETECEGLRLPVHVRFLLDEFANIGTIPEFDQKLATMRKYEISCTIVLQALSQLKAMYKDEWEVIVANCDTQVFLGGTDKTTLEYLSDKLGKQTIRAQNTSRTYGRSGSSNVSYNTTGRELMTKDELSRMDNDNSIIFIRGVLPFFTKKYDYPRHANYKYTGDASSKQTYNVKESLHTAQKKPTQAEKARQKRGFLTVCANQTDPSHAKLQEQKRNYRRHRSKEIEEKNQELLAKERNLMCDLDCETAAEVIAKNNLHLTEEELQEAVNDRFVVIDTSEFDIDDDM